MPVASDAALGHDMLRMLLFSGQSCQGCSQLLPESSYVTQPLVVRNKALVRHLQVGHGAGILLLKPSCDYGPLIRFAISSHDWVPQCLLQSPLC